METKMKQFALIDPLNIENDPRIVGKIIDHEAAYRDNIYYLAIDTSHATLAVHSYYTDPDTYESRWLTYQLEFPKAGLRWIVDTINNKFFKTPDEGGLPSGVYHYEEVIDGEELGINRSMNLGTNENRQSGYTFTTLSRKPEGRTVPKSLSFTDTFLFDRGFLKLIEDTAKRIESGEL